LADNPLLPKDRLRELYALTQRARALERRQQRGASRGAAESPARGPAREALLAAVSIHLQAGDLLSAPAGDRSARELVPQPQGHDVPLSLRLPLCAGAARGMQAAGAKTIVVALATAGTRETGWADALTWAHDDELPLLTVCYGAPGGRASAGALTWTEVSRHAQRLRLPLFPVDGEDAVAVYRVMHEASQRARDGLGPSVLWAVLNSPGVGKGRSASTQPLGRLRAYLRARGIEPGSA
jgi:pyruvate dehydrogenase E1 component alpha subunit